MEVQRVKKHGEQFMSCCIGLNKLSQNKEFCQWSIIQLDCFFL